jgi:hypothetical protein
MPNSWIISVSTEHRLLSIMLLLLSGYQATEQRLIAFVGSNGYQASQPFRSVYSRTIDVERLATTA